jgi:hypothetical protein
MAPWKVQLLRVTLFVSPDADPSFEALSWAGLTGAKPESVQNKAGDEREEGPFLGGRLLLQKQPRRVDLYHARTVSDEEEAEDPVATLGELEPAFESVRGVVSKLLESLRTCCVRIALGTDMVQPVETVQAAYKTLVNHIRSATFSLEGAQEWLYQVNRPRESKVLKPLVVNRLTRWHASSWQAVRFQVVVGTGPEARAYGPTRIGAVVSTDVSTQADRGDPLPGGSLLPLLEELRGLTVEIRDRGDIP